MITIGMNYKVLPGKREPFEEVFAAVLRLMDTMPGHGRTRLYRDVHDSDRYLIVSEWSDRAAFEAFIASEQFRKVADWGSRQILAERPTHDYYEAQRAAEGGGCPVHGRSDHAPKHAPSHGERP
jgi:heme-degrading monooxygenase HmoA